MACGACGPTAPPVATPLPVGPPVAARLRYGPPVATPPLESVPPARLPHSFVPASYHARLSVDPGQRELVGTIAIDGDIATPVTSLWLHGHGLRIMSAELSGGGHSQPLQTSYEDHDLLLLRAATPISPGAHRLTISYRGWISQDTRVGAYRSELDGQAYVATQLESIYARRVFPCLDEPGFKVPWQLTLEVPRDSVVVSNTAVTSERSLDRMIKEVVFAPTRPLPSYLIAFAVGPFEILPAGSTRAGKPIRVIVPRGHASEAAWPVETTAKLLGLLEGYFAMPYPYSKLDVLAVPAEDASWMDSPGLVAFPRNVALHAPERQGLVQRHEWLRAAAHELAHQWFGDAVTFAWWDDLWLAEGVATWLAGKITAAFDPRFDADTAALADRWNALNADEPEPGRAIRHPVVTVEDILGEFDSITYKKGSSVIAMFERAVGAEAMRTGVRAYIAAHRDHTATASDLLAAISKVAHRDVGPAFSSFLEQPGVPVVHAELRCATGRAPVVVLHQVRGAPPGEPEATDGAWRIPVCVAFGRNATRGEACTELVTPTAELTLPAPCPAWLFGNAGGRGYYRTAQPEAAERALRDHGWSRLTAIERAVLAGDLTARALGGQLDPAVPLGLVPDLLAAHDLGSIDRALEIASRFERWTAPAQQPAFRSWIRATFGSTAHRLGWQARAGDDAVDAVARAPLVALVADAGDAALREDADRLARDWRALVPEEAPEVLGVAVDGDRSTFEQLLAAAPAERDPRRRAALLDALAGVAAPDRLRAVLALVFDKRLDLVEASQLTVQAAPAQRAVVASYLREHVAELLERFPDGVTHCTAWFARSLLSCDPATRDSEVAFARATFGEMTDATHLLDRAFARRDRCVAFQHRLAAPIAAWLARP